MKKATLAFSGVIVALSAWVIFMTFSMRNSIISYDIGPAVYPRLLCGLLIALAILLVIFDCFVKKEDERLAFLTGRNALHILVAFVFLAAMEYVGFPICAFAVLVVFVKIMGCPTWWQNIAFSAAATAFVFFVFRYLLNVRLPFGLLEFLM